jgi:hypothetical protein
VHALEERAASIEGALEASHRQQEAPSVPNMESSPDSQRRSSVASTEHPAGVRTEMVADNQQHYPMDDITVRNPCELLYQQRKKIKVVARGIAEVPAQGRTIHGASIPEGYARVMVDRVEKGWEDLDLEIPVGDGEEELQHALHTWICWNKRYTRFPQGNTNFTASPQNPMPRSPPSPPAQRGPSMDLPSPSPQRDPNMDPPLPTAQRDPSMSPPPPKVKKTAKAWVLPPPPP